MQHKINLLPWREQKREEHKRRFVGLLVLGTLIAVGFQWGFGQYFSYQQRLQQERLDYLNHYIAQLDKRIQSMNIAKEEHGQILARLKVVESLQAERNKTTVFMSLMTEVIPDGVYVDKIKMNANEVEIAGISDSTARLATMLDNLERSPFLKDVEMHSIVHDKERFGKSFQTFTVSFVFNERISEEAEREKSNG
ncbi:PilN domain-containing protein [Vibrio vulnificus]|nr:PilN domain-containing protein [Vibrio vulnificus]